MRDRVNNERCAISHTAVSGDVSLLTSEVRNRVKSERLAASLAVVGGYGSPADKHGEGQFEE